MGCLIKVRAALTMRSPKVADREPWHGGGGDCVGLSEHDTANRSKNDVETLSLFARAHCTFKCDVHKSEYNHITPIHMHLMRIHSPGPIASVVEELLLLFTLALECTVLELPTLRLCVSYSFEFDYVCAFRLRSAVCLFAKPRADATI